MGHLEGLTSLEIILYIKNVLVFNYEFDVARKVP